MRMCTINTSTPNKKSIVNHPGSVEIQFKTRHSFFEYSTIAWYGISEKHTCVGWFPPCRIDNKQRIIPQLCQIQLEIIFINGQTLCVCGEGHSINQHLFWSIVSSCKMSVQIPHMAAHFIPRNKTITLNIIVPLVEPVIRVHVLHRILRMTVKCKNHQQYYINNKIFHKNKTFFYYL